MTRWTIDGRGDTGTRANHYRSSGEYVRYNVSRISEGYWLSELICRDGSTLQIDASEMTEAGAQARCEFHAANYVS
jgi:hypothetical protein